jgi:hypothetical protein
MTQILKIAGRVMMAEDLAKASDAVVSALADDA